MKLYEKETAVLIKNRAYQIMTEHAKGTFPFESCGILTGNKQSKTINSIRMIRNDLMIIDSSDHFRMDPLELFKVERICENEGHDILGFYHSHPCAQAVPSDEDIEYMLPGMIYVILSVTANGCVDVRGYIKEQVDDTVCEISLAREVAVY